MSTKNLEKEIKQSQPFATLCQETALSILRTADGIHRQYEETMAPFGITFQQYNVLRIVRGAGADGIPTTSIAERMIEQSPGLTRLLDRLEQKNFVTRVRSAQDRRVVACHLSKSAATLLEQMEPRIRQVEQSVMKKMKTEQLKILNELLSQVREGF
jgi:MarR family transcriptional regulator, organic hydroperoxide resistance regulator